MSLHGGIRSSLSDWFGRMRAGGRHVSNLSSFIVARIAALALFILPVPLFINRQGDSTYGALTLLLLLFSYLHVFDLGIGYAINQRLGRALARGNATAHDIVRTAVPQFVICTVFAAALVYAGADYVALAMSGTSEHAQAIQTLSLSVIFLMVSALCTAIMQAHNRVDWINYSRLILDVAKAIGVTVGAFAPDGIITVIVVLVIGSGVKAAIDLRLAARLAGGDSRFCAQLQPR